MALDLTLSNAISGLQAAQTNLALISANLANAQTPGYSRETLPEQTQVVGAGTSGVSTGVAARVVDQVLNGSLRAQTSISSAAATTDSYFQRIQDLFGKVSDNTSLSGTFAKFATGLQALASTPEDTVAQSAVVAAGQNLTEQLNSLSSSIQRLRGNADTDIGTSINTVNSLLNAIVRSNVAIAHANAFNQSSAALEDQRDQELQQLSQQLNIQSFTDANNQVVVLTGGGKTLVDGTFAEQLSFTPTSIFSATTPGSKITLNGLDITGDVQSGNIGALLQIRDTQLPNLTAEFNQFTKNLFSVGQVPQSSQIHTINGTPQAGDTFTVTIDGTSVTTAAPGLPANPTVTDIVSALNAAIATKPALANFSASVNGNNVQITDGSGNVVTSSIVVAGGPGTETFTAGVLATTDSGLSGPAPGDAHHFFAGVLSGSADNAATIEVNPSLVDNPSLLNGTPGNPDPTISQLLASNISSATPVFAPAGNFTSTQSLTLSAYSGQILGQNATAASAASDNASFQTGVQNEITARAQSVSGVNMDQELASLGVYQTAYSASAHVVQVVAALFQTLLQIQPGG